MDKKDRKKEKETFYYVNPNTPPDPKADVSCANSHCMNFIPIHQTCNLKVILISAEGKCEFSVKRKITKLEKKIGQLWKSKRR